MNKSQHVAHLQVKDRLATKFVDIYVYIYIYEWNHIVSFFFYQFLVARIYDSKPQG